MRSETVTLLGKVHCHHTVGLLSDAFPIPDIANRTQNSSLLSQDMTLASWLNSLGNYYQIIGIDLYVAAYLLSWKGT